MDAGVSAISVADICIRYGALLVQACKSYRSGDREIREAVLKIESHWLKIERQLEFLRKIWPSLDEDYQIHQNTVLQVLQSKVAASTALIDGLIGKADAEASVKSIRSKKGDARRAKYAVWTKSKLLDALAELKDWSEAFDVSWYLIILQSNEVIDHELKPVTESDDTPLSTLKDLRDAINSTISNSAEAEKTTVFLSANEFKDTPTKIEHSSLELWQNLDGTVNYLVDPPGDTSTLADICNLAKILKNVEPLQFGILCCNGVLKLPPDPTLGVQSPFSTRFVFSVPSEYKQPQSLRSLIMGGMETQPLDERFLLARQLAKAVMFVHSAGFVHKNVRPETALVLQNSNQEPHAFLTGFMNFRMDQSKTLLRGDDLWEKNLYRHPLRQGTHPEEDYVMQHDIYSLGVCLLEIGMATSLVHYESDDSAVPSPLLVNAFNPSIKDKRKKAFELKRALVNLAKEQLPPKVGKTYADTVITCLTCLDKTENEFGLEADFLDENGLLVGVRFIEKILTSLLDIKI
ncbi:hypothetical protein F5884DRAFT_343515 [Xylogone sp. PMI_703]|nr:hypothetical protein F5884DRAFT_343515 [Xylogone sp. PMI_703]